MAATLGEHLVREGIVTDQGLQRALAHQGANGVTLVKAISELGLASDEDIVRGIAAAMHMPFADMGPGSVDTTAAGMLRRSVARELTALPVKFSGSEMVVAVADPAQTNVAERLSSELGVPVVLALASRKPLLAAIEALADPSMDTAAPEGAPIAPAAGAEYVKPADRRISGPAEPEREASSAEPLLASEQESEIDLDELLSTLVDSGGSDLHLTIGIPPAIRVHGDLRHLDEFPVQKPDELRKMLYSIMTQRQRETYENNLELDFSYSIPGKARFRVNVFQQRESIGSVMRVIPFEILALKDLGLPPQLANFAYLPRGFVLVTGPTGSGKSTTLASIIDLINENRPVHIMTVEDPIEFLHKHKRSVVNQREVGQDTHSFTAALKHVLRQDPDVILVGEMRDLETISIALTAAETGHLVFGTLHTQDAPQTVDRIIDVFPPHQQEQIRVQLAGALQGVVCQTLLKTADGKGRAAATEIMIATAAIKNLIREGKTHQIYSSIQAGAQHGMHAMDASLSDLVKAGKVRYEDALEKCANVAEFQRLAGRA
jgi:twitching motility protein PilT